MQRQLNLAKGFLERIKARFEECHLKDYVQSNISKKESINELLGLTAANDYTVTLPVELDNSTVMSTYCFLHAMITDVILKHAYKDIDYVKGTIVNPKGQTIKITRVITKFQEQLIVHPHYSRACRELGIADDSFASICPRIGELAHASNQELFITSSIAEFMMVNDNSSYTSCYRHGVFTSSSYWTGTLSYAIDTFTLLVGIRNKDTKYKTGRSWLWLFADGIDSNGGDMGSPFMVQPKSYGEFTSLHRKAVRRYIQSKIDKASTWKAGKLGSMKHNSNYGYIDNYDLTISWIKGEDKPSPYIQFASNLYCLTCGNTDDITSGDGNCWECTEDEDACRCASCGERVHQDDAYWVSDAPYCSDCYHDRFLYCDHCGEDSAIEDSQEVRGISRNGRLYTQTVCEYCVDNSSSISYCDSCNTYYFNREIGAHETVEGENVCDDCVTDVCDKCGNAFTSNDSTFELEDKIYCRHCVEHIEAESDEEECEEAA